MTSQRLTAYAGKPFGDVAQLGERRPRTAEVVGSSPIVSTIISRGYEYVVAPFSSLNSQKFLNNILFLLLILTSWLDCECFWLISLIFLP